MNSSKQPPTIDFRDLLRTAIWALTLTWSTSARLVLLLLGSTLIGSVLPAALALIGRSLINTLVALLEKGSDDLGPLLLWLGLGLLFTLANAIINALQTFFKLRLQDELDIRVSLDIMKHAAKLELAFFEDPSSQDMLERAKKNASALVVNFVNNGLALANNLIQIVSLFAILLVIEPLVTLVLLPLLLPYLLFQWRLGQLRYEVEYKRTAKRRWNHYFMTLLTHQKWVPEVKLLSLVPLLIDKARHLIVEFKNQNRHLYMRNLIGNALFVIWATVGFYALLVRIARRVLAGTLTVGDLTIYSGTTARLSTLLQNTVLSIRKLRENMLHLSDLAAFLEVQTAEKKIGQPVTSQKGVIEFKNVSFAYPGSTKPILSNLSFRFAPSESVALVGENGAGKSTMAKLIARLYEPTEGQILFDGVDISDFSLTAWQKQISFVFQDFNRYEATAADNIAYGDWNQLLPSEAAQEQIKQIARLAKVDELICTMPQGYDTMLGRRFGQYTPSTGQWQKLAIARAFAHQDSLLLILDEPTASLDARAEYELFSHFRELAAGRTAILISHRFSTVSMADRILVLDKGRLIESGSHEALLAQGRHYARLYELHQRQMMPSENNAGTR
ncbi:MAG: ABC transporter ATP-binding protein [Ardenticatenaceae bacterium]